MRTKRNLVAILSAFLVMAATVAPAPAQRPGRKPPVRPTTTRPPAPAKTTPKKTEPITAIVGADIYTVSREVVRRGVLLLQGGKILDIGQGLKIPKGAKVIDAKGKYISPGFVAVNMSRIGLSSISTSSTAKPTDGLNPYDRNIKVVLGVGITTGCVQVSGTTRGPFGMPKARFLGIEPATDELPPDFNPDFGDPDTSTCPCCGLPVLSKFPIFATRPSPMSLQNHVVLKMSYGDAQNMLLAQTPVYGVSAGSLAGQLNRHKWRDSIAKAKKYLKDQAAHEKEVKAGKKSKPPRKTVKDGLIKLVKKEIYLRTSADSVDDIRDMIALAKELDYKLMLEDVAEGWLTAEELADARVPVVITPRRLRDPQVGREGESGSSIEMSGILEKASVPFAVTPLSSSVSMNGLAGRDLTSLPLEAAFAIRGGASEKAALAALTIVPAQMLGLQDRIGSIEKGKDADLLILDGPPLDYRTYVETAIVGGKVVYERAKDRIYPVFKR